MIQNLLLLLNAVSAVALVLVILLQRQDTSGGGLMGGANMGAAPVTRNPLAKTTTYLAILFMGSSLALAVLSKGAGKSESIFETTQQQPVVEAPAGNAPVEPVSPPLPDTTPTSDNSAAGDALPVPVVPALEPTSEAAQ